MVTKINKVQKNGKIGTMEINKNAFFHFNIIKWVFRHPMTTQLQVGKWHGLR